MGNKHYGDWLVSPSKDYVIVNKVIHENSNFADFEFQNCS